MAVLLLADGRLQGNRFLRNAQNLTHLVHRHIQLCCDLLRRRVAPVFVQQLRVRLFDLVDRFNHVYGDADGTRLIGDGTCNRLTDPPRCVGREFEPLCVVELVHGFNKPQIPLLDQIEKLHAAPDVPFCNAYDQSKIRFRETLLGLLVVFTDAHGKLDFFLRRQQRHAADLFEIDLNGIVHGGRAVFRLGSGSLLPFGHLAVEIQIFQHRIAHIIHDFDILCFDGLIQAVEVFHIDVHFHNDCVDFLCRQFAGCLTSFQKCSDN